MGSTHLERSQADDDAECEEHEGDEEPEDAPHCNGMVSVEGHIEFVGGSIENGKSE